MSERWWSPLTWVTTTSEQSLSRANRRTAVTQPALGSGRSPRIDTAICRRPPEPGFGWSARRLSELCPRAKAQSGLTSPVPSKVRVQSSRQETMSARLVIGRTIRARAVEPPRKPTPASSTVPPRIRAAQASAVCQASRLANVRCTDNSPAFSAKTIRSVAAAP